MQKTTKSSAATPPEPTDIGILLFPEFSNLCLANAVEPLRAANSLARRPLYRWHFLGMQSGTIHSSSKLPVHIDTRLSAYGGGDILLVMPSYGHLAHATPATLAALRACAPRNQMMVGLDTGSWLLGAAGLLDGYVTMVIGTPLPQLCSDLIGLMISESAGHLDDTASQHFLEPRIVLPEML